MRKKEFYIAIGFRALRLAFIVGAVSILAELGFVFGIRLLGSPVPLTSFFAVGMFSGIIGLMPVLPSPSRLSPEPIDLWGRFFLLMEFSVIVGAAIFASSKFIAYNHVIVPIGIGFAVYVYLLFLISALVINFGRLRREISAAG